MRFLFDESADARLVPYLEGLGHDVTRVAREYPRGLRDPQVLATARAEQRTIVTEDLDFGELVFRQGYLHTGVILFRLEETDLAMKIARLDDVLSNYADRLDQFLVVTARRVRARQTG